MDGLLSMTNVGQQDINMIVNMPTGSSTILTAANSNTSLLSARAGLRNYLTSVSVSWIGSGSILVNTLATVWNSGSILWRASLASPTGSAYISQDFVFGLPSIWTNSVVSGSIDRAAQIQINVSGFIAP